MKELLLVMCFLMQIGISSAQENESVDSIGVKAGVIYYADSTQVTDSICADTINCTNPLIPQIPLEKCDCLMTRDVIDHYGVVYKDGKCGIYDLIKIKT